VTAQINVRQANAEAIAEAARILRGGGLVSFPTETVYGLGGDATQSRAVARIFAAKGRPRFNPLIVHVADRTWVAGMAIPDGRFDKLARAFWPGPLTLVMHRRRDCPAVDLVSAGLDSIAVRMPDHDIAQELLRAVKRPLAAPSANLSGTISPTSAAHVATSLGANVDMIIDGGACRVGLESTVLDLTHHAPQILRPGAITAEQLSAVIGPVHVATSDPAAPKAPGQLASHYAPALALRLNATDTRPGEALIGFGAGANTAFNLSLGKDLVEAAANLFAMMRAADDPSRFTGIAVAPIPETGIGIAINDRLKRAAAPKT
jgi:L-threonylcarbamoyladenylate synthase